MVNVSQNHLVLVNFLEYLNIPLSPDQEGASTLLQPPSLDQEEV